MLSKIIEAEKNLTAKIIETREVLDSIATDDIDNALADLEASAKDATSRLDQSFAMFASIMSEFQSRVQSSLDRLDSIGQASEPAPKKSHRKKIESVEAQESPTIANTTSEAKDEGRADEPAPIASESEPEAIPPKVERVVMEGDFDRPTILSKYRTAKDMHPGMLVLIRAAEEGSPFQAFDADAKTIASVLRLDPRPFSDMKAHVEAEITIDPNDIEEATRALLKAGHRVAIADASALVYASSEESASTVEAKEEEESEPIDLTDEDRVKLAREMLDINPKRSNKSIAKATGLDKPTIAKLRSEMKGEAKGEFEQAFASAS